LDKMNEKICQDAIDNYRKINGGVTVIVIAHRLSTIQDADKIIVLVNGELTEQGSHQSLHRDYPHGTYVDFCEKQKSAEAEAPPDEQQDEADLDTLGAGIK